MKRNIYQIISLSAKCKTLLSKTHLLMIKTRRENTLFFKHVMTWKTMNSWTWSMRGGKCKRFNYLLTRANNNRREYNKYQSVLRNQEPITWDRSVFTKWEMTFLTKSTPSWELHRLNILINQKFSNCSNRNTLKNSSRCQWISLNCSIWNRFKASDFMIFF